MEQEGAELKSYEPNTLQVGIHWQIPGLCAAHSLCRHMHFLRDSHSAVLWQAEAPEERECFTVEQALALGSAFFRPLMLTE